MFNFNTIKGITPILIPVFAGIVILLILGGTLFYYLWWPELKPECAKNEDCGIDSCQQGREKCVEIKYICENGKCVFPAKTEEFPSPRYKCWEGKCQEVKPPEEIPDITVISPPKEEKWEIGKTYQIQWEPSDSRGVVVIRLYKVPPLSLNLVWEPSESPPNTGSYSFTVFEWLEPGRYQFFIAAYVSELEGYKGYSGEFFIVSKTMEDETANWKVYRNEEYGYEIEYPEGWPVNDKDLKHVVFGNIPYEPSAGSINVTIENKNLSLSLNEHKNNFPDGCPQEEEVTLTNFRAIKVICIEPFAGQEVISYFIEKNDNKGYWVYTINFFKGREELNQIFNQMLSTFKFIE